MCADGAGNVIAVGDNGTVIRSTNAGTTWAAATTPAAGASALYAVATNGTTVIYGGAAGLVGTSTNAGDTWAAAAVGSATHRALFWSAVKSLFLLGSEGGGLRTSPSVIAWTTRTSGTTNRIQCFAEGPNHIIAGVYQTTRFHAPNLIYSGDGLTWSPHHQVFPFEIKAIAGPGSSVYLERGFIVVGESEFFGYAREANHTFSLEQVGLYDLLQEEASPSLDMLVAGLL